MSTKRKASSGEDSKEKKPKTVKITEHLPECHTGDEEYSKCAFCQDVIVNHTNVVWHEGKEYCSSACEKGRPKMSCYFCRLIITGQEHALSKATFYPKAGGHRTTSHEVFCGDCFSAAMHKSYKEYEEEMKHFKKHPPREKKAKKKGT